MLNIFPSIDTAVCAASVRTFNERASQRDGVNVLCVSADLPFAQSRFCGAEGIDRVKTASTFRSTFGNDYGVTLADGPLAGLLARAVVVVGADGNVVYTELVPEIAQEPNYDAALAALEPAAGACCRCQRSAAGEDAHGGQSVRMRSASTLSRSCAHASARRCTHRRDERQVAIEALGLGRPHRDDLEQASVTSPDVVLAIVERGPPACPLEPRRSAGSMVTTPWRRGRCGAACRRLIDMHRS